MLLVFERTLKVRVGFGGIGPLVFKFQRLEICFQFMSVLLVFFFFRCMPRSRIDGKYSRHISEEIKGT